MRASTIALFALLFVTEALSAVTLSPVDALLPVPCGQGPPALEAHPFDANTAFLVCTTELPGASGISVNPATPLGLSGVDYFLPAGLDCSESISNCGDPTSFTVGTVGNLFLDPMAGALNRGWLTTSNCELVVPFDAVSGGDWSLLYAGGARRSVPTKRCITGAFTTYESGSAGSAITDFATNLTSDVVRVGNRLLVSTSNYALAGSNPVLNPGTVLLFDIDDSGPDTMVTPATPPFIITSDPNPTALSILPGGLVGVTNTGLHDVAFPPQVTGVGSIDIIDPGIGTILGSFPLGAGNPGGRTLAIDATGSVAVVGSNTLRALFAVDIRGLGDLPVPAIDPAVQRPSCNDVTGPEAGGVPCLRDRVIHDFDDPILLPPPPGGSGNAGFLVEVRFGASGDFIAATSFNDGGLGLLAFDPRHLDRPHPLLPSRFGPPETVAATPPAGEYGSECCPGPMILHPNSAAGVNGSDVVWLTFGPDGIVARARLSGALGVATGDADTDGWEDAVDRCPLFPDPAQTDTNGDGVGDACQCGDVNGDLAVTQSDADALRAFLADATPSLPAAQNCTIAEDPGCDLLDLAILMRALGGRSSGIPKACEPPLL
jgi:hypothetical protein